MRTTAAAYYYWRNQGNGSWSEPWSSPPIPSQQVLLSDPEVRLADMNGDRLVDLVSLRPGSLVYWPNQGHGRWGGSVLVAGAPDAGPDHLRLQLADANGDGLADLALVIGGQVQIWLQDGSGRFASAIGVQNLPPTDPARTFVRLADMNGSGTTDIVWNNAGSSIWRYLDLTGGVRPNLLVSVDNGLGRRIAIGYSSSGAMYQRTREAGGQAWTTRLPFPVQVVAHVTVQDGRGWTSTKGFRYRDGYYDGTTRQFRGFGQAIETELGDDDEASAVRVHDYDLGIVDEALAGTEKQAETRDDKGLVYERRVSGFEARLYATGTDGRRVAGALRRWSEVHHVEGAAAPIVTREDFNYDDFGNVSFHAAWGIVEGSNRLAAGDERLTITEYINDTSRWLLGRAYHQTVGEPAADATLGSVPSLRRKLAETRSYYDGAPFVGLPLGTLGNQGAPARTEAWVQGERFIPTERLQRDDFGQVVARLDPADRHFKLRVTSR